MSRYIITLGSNVGNRNEMVSAGINWLKETLIVRSSTDVYSSPDAYHAGRPPYANAIVIAEAECDAATLDRMFKAYELNQGRDRQTKAVPIDIDVVVKDTEILRLRDYTAPYFLLGLPRLSNAEIRPLSTMEV